MVKEGTEKCMNNIGVLRTLVYNLRWDKINRKRKQPMTESFNTNISNILDKLTNISNIQISGTKYSSITDWNFFMNGWKTS